MQLLSWPLPLNRKIYVFGGSYAFCEGNILSALRAFHTTTIECNFDVQRLFWQSPPINRQRSCSSCVAFDCVNFGPLRYCVKFLAGFVESIPHRCYHFGRRIRRTKFFKCLRARSSSNSDPPSTNLRHLNMRNYCKRDFAWEFLQRSLCALITTCPAPTVLRAHLTADECWLIAGEMRTIQRVNSSLSNGSTTASPLSTSLSSTTVNYFKASSSKQHLLAEEDEVLTVCLQHDPNEEPLCSEVSYFKVFGFFL
jgi:hypothetical protein